LHGVRNDSQRGHVTAFKTVPFETLVDSPVIAGKYFKKIDLDPGGRSRVTLNVMADEPEFLEVSPKVLEIHRELVRQADKLYGARHFDHYDFLLSLSDRLATSGIEHQRSSDNGADPKYFTTWDTAFTQPRFASARVQPFVEWQIPPSCRSVDSQLQRADAGQPALGLRGPNAILRVGVGNSRWLPHKAAVARQSRRYGCGV
jgi:hypothetical protein